MIAPIVGSTRRNPSSNTGDKKRKARNELPKVYIIVRDGETRTVVGAMLITKCLDISGMLQLTCASNMINRRRVSEMCLGF